LALEWSHTNFIASLLAQQADIMLADEYGDPWPTLATVPVSNDIWIWDRCASRKISPGHEHDRYLRKWKHLDLCPVN
jgi:hypothetical protein